MCSKKSRVMLTLERLAKTLKVTSEHPWKRYADLVCECGGLADATPTGFSVQLADGNRDIEFVGGLTNEHYCYFAPLLNDLDKTDLARAVLRNERRYSFLDWETASWLLELRHGKDIDDWLPKRVSAEGFAAIASEIDELLKQHWMRHPKPRLKTWTFEKPRFDPNSGVLRWGDRSWRIRKQPTKPVWELLCALERRKFPQCITLDSLSPDQVHEARKVLHRKTKPFINWHAAVDGYLSWDAS
jgi:hypothetical protein